MYELSKEIFMVNGSASNFPNNLDIHYDESKKLTYACIVHKQQVDLLQIFCSVFYK